jgi:hypothetical protein
MFGFTGLNSVPFEERVRRPYGRPRGDAPAGLGSLANFHDPLAGLQARAHAGPSPFDGGQQSGVAAVAQADPDQLDGAVGLRRLVKEVIVFADQDELAPAA